MRTTVRLNDNVLKSAKKIAVQRHTSLTALIEAGLRYIVSLSSSPSRPGKSIKLKTAGGTGLQHGVDLDDNAGLLEKTG